MPELPIADARGVVGLGYGESKWAAESVLLRAAREAGLRANVVRVGQLSGDRARGGWNAKEWVPALLQASQVLGAVPIREEVRGSRLLLSLHTESGILTDARA